MKKFLSAILSFAMIFALSIPAFAADITVAPTETVTNEYQSMLELQKFSNATLAAEGYTPSEIETIRNTDQIFDDHIALLNTLSDNSLNRPLSSRQVKKEKLRHEGLVPVSKGSQAL